jgi:hypothetical protein
VAGKIFGTLTYEASNCGFVLDIVYVCPSAGSVEKYLFTTSLGSERQVAKSG